MVEHNSICHWTQWLERRLPSLKVPLYHSLSSHSPCNFYFAQNSSLAPLMEPSLSVKFKKKKKKKKKEKKRSCSSQYFRNSIDHLVNEINANIYILTNKDPVSSSMPEAPEA